MNKKCYIRMGILLMAMPLLMLSCQKKDDTKQTMNTSDQAQLAEKLKLYQEQGIISLKNGTSDLTYAATLCNESDITAQAVPRQYQYPGNWTYYKFYGKEGQGLDIYVVRITCEMDPSYSLYFGTSTTTDGIHPRSSSNPDLTWLFFRDDQIPRPTSCAGHCSAYGDPGPHVTLPHTGWYTLAVFDYFSCGGVTELYYNLTVSGLAPCTIVIDGCNTNVSNQLIEGVYMQESIDACAENAKNHGQFVSCVAHLTNAWVAAGLITDVEKDAIMTCAAQSNIP